MAIHSVGVVYDQMTDDVEIQILRDLMILKGQWPDTWVNDPEGKADLDLLSQIGVFPTKDTPIVVISYKVGYEYVPVSSYFPAVAHHVDVVTRDLNPPDGTQELDGGDHIGYYLRPQGRDGANLTEMYLNRSHPRGTGVADPFVVLLWG